MPDNAGPTRGFSRRTALRVAGGAGALWIVPIVNVVSMETASAASAPPSRVQPGVTPVAQAGAPISAGGATLPNTGSGDAAAALAVGLGAIAVGGGVAVAANRFTRTVGESSPDPDV